ncbi:MAG: ABC transporter ATP-binding protein [Promethearchaeota archaeon]
MFKISTDAVLVVSNLTKIYGHEIKIGRLKVGRVAIGAQNVSFSIRKGEIFGFLGPNGAGKTTTIRSILGYLKIQTGTIIINGLDHQKDSIEIRKNIGYVPGDLSLYDDFTGEELINYFSKFRQIDQNFLQELKTIFNVNLSQKVESLSTGNRKQVALILALTSKPNFLILDEPTTGLDPLMTAKFHKILKRLKSEGKTIFLSSHDLAEVQTVCDRVGIIKEGRMLLVENIVDLKQKFLQNVKIQFSSKNLPTENDFKNIDSIISIEKLDRTTFKLIIKEDVNEMLRWLINYRIKRLTIEDASLEDIFLKFYE